MTRVIPEHIIAGKGEHAHQDTFTHLMRQYQPRICHIVERYTHDPYEAEDISQEVFLKVYYALPRFRNESQISTWLYRIAVNTTKNYLKAKSHRVPSVDLDVMTLENYGYHYHRLQDPSSPELLLLRDELEKCLLKTVNHLSPEVAQAFILREWIGLSYQEISDSMGVPIGTVRSRIHRVKSALMDSYKQWAH